ncbi:TatD family hydrolase [Pseudenhygromyxa sp. WMMC2535]|uniref:TatD family hydrolase n=1 Tax=Pseudenhygromyxa sp. WMMC2535 TaxID=2712867 RepID=UPI00155605DB|nr:TatD family hydrolase [Pseudenhygromyxa sp. WMMC2535]NVB41130.1 TatD family hydrolase [Pseudenhygromyxa sp. WMMC2535]
MARKPKQPPHIPGLIDSHCHLDYEPMAADLDATLARARAAGVVQVVHIGCSPQTMAPAVAIAAANEQVFASVGVHPHDARLLDAALLAEIEAHAAHPKVVALGETGLDYHYDFSPRAAQLEAFGRQADLARRLQKPLVLHIRDAHEDAWAVLAEHPARAEAPGVVHCFTGTPAEAERWLSLGWHISFSGISTFKKAAELREAAKLVPRERIMLETDAPYLAPEPMRGRKNEPANVAFTCARLATERGEAPEALAAAAAANTRALFGLPTPAQSQ